MSKPLTIEYSFKLALKQTKVYIERWDEFAGLKAYKSYYYSRNNRTSNPFLPSLLSYVLVLFTIELITLSSPILPNITGFTSKALLIGLLFLVLLQPLLFAHSKFLQLFRDKDN